MLSSRLLCSLVLLLLGPRAFTRACVCFYSWPDMGMLCHLKGGLHLPSGSSLEESLEDDVDLEGDLVFPVCPQNSAWLWKAFHGDINGELNWVGWVKSKKLTMVLKTILLKKFILWVISTQKHFSFLLEEEGSCRQRCEVMCQKHHW